MPECESDQQHAVVVALIELAINKQTNKHQNETKKEQCKVLKGNCITYISTPLRKNQFVFWSECLSYQACSQIPPKISILLDTVFAKTT